MRQCPKCATVNTDTSQYCERCGTPLAKSETSRATSTPSYQSAYQSPYQEAAPQETPYSQYAAKPIQYPIPVPFDTPPPPPPSYNETPLYQSFVPQAPAQPDTGKRSALGTVLSILLYLWGGFCVAFGIASIFIPADNNTLVGGGFLLYCLVSLLALIPILILHRRPIIKGWLRLTFFVAAGILAVIGIIVVFVALGNGSSHTSNAEYVALGYICIVYGLAMQVVAAL